MRAVKRFADVSLTHVPVPAVPQAVLEDSVVNATLQEHSELFAITTPIHVNRFKAPQEDHPNHDFAASVVRALREGLWPYTNAKLTMYPDTWDEHRSSLMDEASMVFLLEQRNEEVVLGRYLACFGPDLLPEMYSMPVHVVPKPHSSKLRLVNDQNAGEFSPNSIIRPESIKGAVLNGIPALGESLQCFCAVHGRVPLIMWKSDVSQVYRCMPVAPHWQIRQVVTIEEDQHVDRCNLFGGRGFLRVFSTFNALLSWIATKMLLTDKGKQKLINAVDNFCDISSGNWRCSLAAFQAFVGYANWAFNVFPLLKPALSNVYEKMCGKSNQRAAIFVNSAIIHNLKWMRLHVTQSTGVHLLSANTWSLADLVCNDPEDEFTLTDASGHGLGIYFPWLRLGFHSKLPEDASKGTIFFFEALAICSAIHRVRVWQQAGRAVRHLAILSDNTNLVSIFNSLHAEPTYNTILKSTVNIMLACDLNIRVEHIPGKHNVVADALSRGKLQLAQELVSGINLLPLTPPRDALGATAQ
ncbi:hypothetical protein C8Q70DRAFT_1059843 [Cubamyces menziesii]|nr:hypothetical protein C8Q70DRAFT_1059843 [Cubamyces menziesii]